VSHWSVASVATVKFGAFDELKNDPTIGRAVALRRAEMAMLDPKNPPEFAHPLSGRRSCSLAKVAREGKIDRSEMAIRGISAGGLRRSSLVRQTAGYVQVFRRRSSSLWPAASLPASENLHNCCRCAVAGTQTAVRRLQTFAEAGRRHAGRSPSRRLFVGSRPVMATVTTGR
jgi:hypothetical protein